MVQGSYKGSQILSTCFFSPLSRRGLSPCLLPHGLKMAAPSPASGVGSSQKEGKGFCIQREGLPCGIWPTSCWLELWGRITLPSVGSGKWTLVALDSLAEEGRWGKAVADIFQVANLQGLPRALEKDVCKMLNSVPGTRQHLILIS